MHLLHPAHTLRVLFSPLTSTVCLEFTCAMVGVSRHPISLPSSSHALRLALAFTPEAAATWGVHTRSTAKIPEIFPHETACTSRQVPKPCAYRVVELSELQSDSVNGDETNGAKTQKMNGAESRSQTRSTSHRYPLLTSQLFSTSILVVVYYSKVKAKVFKEQQTAVN